MRVNAAAWATSPGFESNDLGFNSRSDRWGGHMALQFLKPEPDGLTRFRSLTLAKSYSYNFDGDKQGDMVNLSARAALRNYWDLGLNGSFRWRGLDDRATRGGPSMSTGEAWNLGSWVGSDGRKPVIGRFGSLVLPQRVRQRAVGERGHGRAAALDGAVAGGRAVVDERAARGAMGDERRRRGAAGRPRRPLRLRRLRAARGLAHAAPGLDLLAAAVAAGLRAAARLARRLRRFKELERARSFDFLVYSPDQLAHDPATMTYTVDPGRGESGPFTFSDPDFSYKSLRVNTVLRWEWRPGSALFAVWMQGRESAANPSETSLGRDLDELLASPATNTLEVKATFRLGD